MKPWQIGYELDFLKEKAARFKDHNDFSLSPFSEMNPRGIAYCEEKGWLEEKNDAIIFNNSIIHNGFTPTDTQRRIMLNMSFFK